jgi:hypothetical protein
MPKKSIELLNRDDHRELKARKAKNETHKGDETMRKYSNLIELLIALSLTLAACGSKPAEPTVTPTINVANDSTYVVENLCDIALVTDGPVAYVTVTKNPTVVITSDDVNKSRSYVSWASAKNPLDIIIGKNKWVHVICGGESDASIVKSMAKREKARNPDWTIWADGMETTFEEAVDLASISQDGGKIHEWVGASSSVKTAQPGTLSYWAYDEQKWVHIKIIANGGKIAIVLPINCSFKNDPMYDNGSGHLIVVDTNGVTYFWAEVSYDGTLIIKAQGRRLYWQLEL